MSAVRYSIFAMPRGYDDGQEPIVVIASGKLTATSSAISDVITVPVPPKDCDIVVEFYSRYTDDVAKTGGGYSYIGIFNATEAASFGTSNVSVEAKPRFVLQPPRPDNLSVKINLNPTPGQKFAILDTGWAV